MVNTGKPSRGCYMCRARRIKCDEAKPSCMRCQKSKRICPGYRDAFELKLRDESKSTKKKLNRRFNQDQSGQNNIVNNITQCDETSLQFGSVTSHSRNRSLSSVRSQFSSTTEQYSQQFLQSFYGPNSRSEYVTSHSRSRSLSSVRAQMSSTRHPYSHPHNVIAANMTTPIQQQAACYFLSNFVLVPEAGTMRGYLDFVLPLMRRNNPETALVYAFSAVTLAALSSRPNSKSLSSTADLWYLKALKEINAALQNPKLASSEATLASVMLMASFEQLTPSRMRVGGWTSHIDGAVAMIKSCPIEKWSTGVGRDIFIAVRAHMTLQCIANARPVDTDIDWLAIHAYDDIVQSFATVNLKMAALRADNDKTTTLKAHTAENIEKVLNLLRRAESLEQEYIDWVKNLPANWDIKTVAWIEGEAPDLANSVIHPGRVDAYGEMWMAYKYNVVRGCRLFIWTVILRCVAWLGDPRDYRLTPEYITASRICQQLVEDIVATVPYFFGWNRDKDGAMADRSNFACGTTDYTSVKPLAGIFVMWPLFAAATSDFASPSQRVFLRGRLKFVAEMMGINQALILFQAQLLHPSLYIARERLNLTPTTRNSTNTSVNNIKQANNISGVLSATIAASMAVPSPPASQDGLAGIASPEADKQKWVPRAASPPKQAWQEAAEIPNQKQDTWSALVATPPVDQVWQANTPPQDQLWQPNTPPQEQVWSASTSPPHDLWKTSSPPNTRDHLWASPPPDSAQSWNSISETQGLPDNHSQVYSLPLSIPRDGLWQQSSSSSAPSCIGELVPAPSRVLDPAQVWEASFEDSAPNWMPRSITEDIDLYCHNPGDEAGIASFIFEDKNYPKGFGVASPPSD